MIVRWFLDMSSDKESSRSAIWITERFDHTKTSRHCSSKSVSFLSVFHIGYTIKGTCLLNKSLDTFSMAALMSL